MYAPPGRKAVFITYANDLFAGTDRYFSQGVELGVRHPSLARLDGAGILSPAKDRGVYAAALRHDAYTPSTIRADSIRRGDRPYSATVTLRLECTTMDSGGRAFFYSALTLGVIGPVAQGREIQTGIHRATGDFIPLGWQHQIRNDLLLNYTFRYQRRLFGHPVASLYAAGRVDAGTLQCRLGAGFSTVIWPLARTRSRVKLSVRTGAYGYAVGYDTRLQGGMFNRTSPYVLRSSEMSLIVGSAYVQARVDYRCVGVGAERTWLTREFEAGLPHTWGRLFIQYFF